MCEPGLVTRAVLEQSSLAEGQHAVPCFLGAEQTLLCTNQQLTWRFEMNTIYRSVRARSSSHARWICAALAFPMLVANEAAADEVCGDTTCERGFVCRSYDIGKCDFGGVATEPADGASAAPSGGASAGIATPSIAVPPREDAGTPSCESYTVHECVPAPCTADTDCADGMVCHTYTSQTCTGTAPTRCAPDQPDCVSEPVPPPECTTTTTSQCVARYQLPCTTASDCGAGFTCEEQQTCWCSGSKPHSEPGAAPAGGSAGVAVPVAVGSGAAASVASGGVSGVATDDVAVNDVAAEEDPACGCAPSGTFACRLQTIACNADADCPSGLICVDNPAGACWAASDGTSGCTTPDPAKVCQPKYYGGSGMGGVDDAVTVNDSSGSSPTSPPTTTVPKGGVSSGDAEPVDDDNGQNDHTQNTPVPGAHHQIGGGWGCSVNVTPGMQHSGILSLLVSVGLALGIRRRRARK